VAKLFEQPRFIAVEGPIRAGKSTLAQVLADTLHARRIAEPENNPFLDRFYQGQAGMAFATQMWFLMERYEQQRELEDFSTPLVSDYLFEKDKVFAYINLSDAELDLYNRYYQMFRADVPTPELVIYLQAPPEALKQRIRRKGVPGERAISDRYIEQVAAATYMASVGQFSDLSLNGAIMAVGAIEARHMTVLASLASNQPGLAPPLAPWPVSGFASLAGAIAPGTGL